MQPATPPSRGRQSRRARRSDRRGAGTPCTCVLWRPHPRPSRWKSLLPTRGRVRRSACRLSDESGHRTPRRNFARGFSCVIPALSKAKGVRRRAVTPNDERPAISRRRCARNLNLRLSRRSERNVITGLVPIAPRRKPVFEYRLAGTYQSPVLPSGGCGPRQLNARRFSFYPELRSLDST